MTRRINRLLPSLLLLAMAGGAQANWAGFYDQQTLVYWQGQTPPGIEENFREVIWPVLAPEEKRSLGNVALSFPLEDGSHPMNFYASSDGTAKTITLPISSLRFFGDLALAYAYFHESGKNLQPIATYLAVLKYQWSGGGLAGRSYRPREVLGIPENATANARVEETFQRIYGSAIVFLLGHELGHLYYKHVHFKHEDDASGERSRQQEEEADRFGLEIMRRIGAAPMGMVQYFTVLALLEPYRSDPDYLETRNNSTHPVTSSRLRAVAAGLRALAPDFARTGTPPAKFANAANEIENLAKNFDDEGVQDMLRQLGLAGKFDTSPNARQAGAKIAAASRAPFSGKYRGKWIDSKGLDFDVTMSLRRTNDTVHGEYRFGEGGVAAVAKMDGIVSGGELHYNWTWGTYKGKGKLMPNASGGGLEGEWGNVQAESGGGRWDLSPVE